MPTEIVALFLASLTGSWHCAGMCGPFAMLIRTENTDPIRLVLYQLGRLTTYALLVLALHLFAQTLPRELGKVIFAVILIAWVLMLVGPVVRRFLTEKGFSAGFVPTIGLRAPPKWMGLVRRATGFSQKLPPRVGAFAIGATTSSVPCLWLYGFVAVAGAQADVFAALTYISVFWLGTLPALLISHFTLHKMSTGLRLYSRRLSFGLIVVSGVVSLWTHSGIWAPPASGAKASHHCHGGTEPSEADQAQSPSSSKPEGHHGHH